MRIVQNQFDKIYYVISDQPDCCRVCGSRLDLVEIKEIDGENVFTSECLGFHLKINLVED